MASPSIRFFSQRPPHPGDDSRDLSSVSRLSNLPSISQVFLPLLHPCLPHADGGLHARPHVEATVIHKSRLILTVHHHPGPCHCGQQWDEVILLCAQCQGQTWGMQQEKSWRWRPRILPSISWLEQGQETPQVGVAIQSWFLGSLKG